jgi:protein TonB
LRPVAGSVILLTHAAVLLGAPWPANEQPAVSAPLAVKVVPSGRTAEAVDAPQIAQLAESSALEAQASAVQPAESAAVKAREVAPVETKEDRPETRPREQHEEEDTPERTELRASEIAALSPHGEVQARPLAPAKPRSAKEKPKQHKKAARENAQASAASRASALAQHSTADVVTGSVAAATYRSIVSAELNRHKYYPPDARAAGTEGVVTVTFTVGPSGRVTHHAIVRSSGAAVLDRAVSQIMAALALPPPPGGQFRATVPIRFDLTH